MARRQINLDKSKSNAKGGFDTDERLWYLKSKDSCEVTGRLVHDPSEEDFAPIYRHEKIEYIDSRGMVKEFKCLCPKTLDKNAPCPICDLASNFYKLGKDEADESDNNKMGKLLYKKKQYLTNFYIKDNPLDEKTNGNVFLVKFGSQAFDRVLAKIKPEESDKKSKKYVDFNPFDPYESCDFNYKYKPGDGKKVYASYSESNFSVPKSKEELSPIIDEYGTAEENEDATNLILDKAYNIREYIASLTDPKLPQFGRILSEEEIINEIGHHLVCLAKGETPSNKPAVTKRQEQQKNTSKNKEINEESSSEFEEEVKPKTTTKSKVKDEPEIEVEIEDEDPPFEPDSDIVSDSEFESWD